MAAIDITDAERQALAWYHHLEQGNTWRPNGRPPLPIADMDAAWRFNAANWLLKRAASLEFYYSYGEVLDLSEPIGNDLFTGEPVHLEMPPEVESDLGRDWESRSADLEAWLKTTDLYQALVKDLPGDAGKHAKHWSTCALRTNHGPCTCWQRHIAECPVNQCRDIDAPCHCNDNSPDWTDD